MSAVLSPSGKSEATENFPVGSFLVEKRLRRHVAAYYAWARAIDDIADAPDLEPEEKLRRLDVMELTLAGAMGRTKPELAVARTLRASLLETGVPFSTALDLVSAFRQDAEQTRYRDWDALMDYCARSAAPVGRYLLHLHGETDKAAFAASDALCKALQVINHMQDCGDDFRQLGRVYLPMEWMERAGAEVSMLEGNESPPPLRAVLDRCIDASRGLMEAARPLPGLLKNRRLAMEAAVIIRIADSLLEELAARDPLKERVKLTKAQYAACFLGGALRALAGGRARGGGA